MADDKVGLEMTPPDLLQRLAKYPEQTQKVMMAAGEAALLVLHENVPPYPDPFPDQKYRRTGQLGRSLGSSMGGGGLGKADIESVAPLGEMGTVTKFGTNLNYAEDVIGENQKPLFVGRWWKFFTIGQRATPKIVQVYLTAATKLVQFLEGNG